MITDRPTAVTAVTDTVTLDHLALAWEEVVQKMPDATPFQSWEWNRAWWSHCGRGNLWVLVARQGEQVVGILPLVLTRYRSTPLRQARFMGAPLSDYQKILAAPEHAATCARAFVDYLNQHRSDWDICDLNDIIETNPLVALISANADYGVVEFHRRCPAIALPSTWEEYVGRLGKNLRSNIGRRRRQLEKSVGATFALVQDPARLASAMKSLYELHNSRWKERGASGAFAAESVQAFHHDVARQFLLRDWLRLYVLEQKGQIIAAFYCFSFARRIYYYLSGFDVSLARYSPGMTLMAFALDKAIGEKAEVFDLLRGDESYKYEWKAEDQITRRVILRHAGFRSWLAFQLHKFERRIEHWGLGWQRRMWGRGRTKSAGAVKGDKVEQEKRTAA